MTALLAGIDWSTRAIHAALIPLDADHGDPDVPPVTFRMATLAGRDTVTRCQQVPGAMMELLSPLMKTWRRPADFDPAVAVWNPTTSVTSTVGHEVASVWIEEAYGNHRTADRALLPIQGAIIASCRHRQVATLTAVEWRKQLGLGRISKSEAIVEAANWLDAQDAPNPRAVDEHMAESLLLALAAREITWRAAA